MTPLMNKLYWPIIIFFALVLVMNIIMFFTQAEDWSDRNYYNWMYFRKIAPLVAIVAGSFYMKYSGNEKMANLILYIPVLIFILFLIGAIIVMILFSKSVK